MRDFYPEIPVPHQKLADFLDSQHNLEIRKAYWLNRFDCCGYEWFFPVVEVLIDRDRGFWLVSLRKSDKEEGVENKWIYAASVFAYLDWQVSAKLDELPTQDVVVDQLIAMWESMPDIIESIDEGEYRDWSYKMVRKMKVDLQERLGRTPFE